MYATFDDLKRTLPYLCESDRAMGETLLAKASAILDGEMALAGVSGAYTVLLRDCCVEMAAAAYSGGAGSEYGTAVDVDASASMKPSSEYRRLIGIPWRRMRAKVASC